MTSSRPTDIQKLQHQLFSLPLDFKLVTAEFIQHLQEQIIQFTQATYDQIAALEKTPEQINFKTAVQPLIDLELVTAKANSLCVFSKNVHPEEKIRNASEEANKEISKTKIDTTQRQDVFRVLKKYSDELHPEESKQLHPEQNRFLKKLMMEYKHNGLAIENDEQRKKIVEKQKKLADLSAEFCSNINKENSSFVFTKDELNGLPETWFTKEREDKTPGSYKVTLQYPDYYPVMDFVKSRNVRQKIYVAFNSRSAKENLPILAEMAQLRQQIANLLGYETHTDLVTEKRMIKTRKALRSFLDDMLHRLKPHFHDRLKKLTEFARELEGDSSLVLQNSDLSYYNRLLIEKELQLNMEEFNSYFSLDRVIEGTFKIYQDILGLQFVKTDAANKWQEDVSHYEVYNSQSNIRGEKIGEFYLDLHPRTGKYSHAAAFDLVAGADISHLSNSELRQLPCAAMVCNFSRDGKLSFDMDVTTFFHEFGHVMHFVCSHTKLPSLNGFGTEVDFVEAPSQMLENWCFDQRVLELFSAHPQTGKPVPAEMVNKLSKMRLAGDIIENVRQLVLSHFDYHIHTLSAEDAEKLDIKTCFRTIQQKIREPLISIDEECFASCFSHMGMGYDVGYYGYMMTNTYAIDMYHSVFRANPLSEKAGAHYRQTILEPGATLDGLELLSNFLGRAPNSIAFFQQYENAESLLKKFHFLQKSSSAEQEKKEELSVAYRA